MEISPGIFQAHAVPDRLPSLSGAVVGRYIALHLRRQKYRVSRAINGAAGEAVIAADAPDVIILDHYLPDTTG